MALPTPHRRKWQASISVFLPVFYHYHRAPAFVSPPINLLTTSFLRKSVSRRRPSRNGFAHHMCAERPDFSNEGSDAPHSSERPTTDSLDLELPYSTSQTLYSAWKQPMWLGIHSVHLAKTMGQHAYKHTRKHSKRFIFARLVCSSLSISLLGSLYLLYGAFNRRTISLITAVASSNLDRSIEVSRVIRCNPVTGIRVGGAIVRSSAKRDSEIVFDAETVDVFLSGFVQFLWTRKPLLVNVSCSRPKFVVSQHAKQKTDGTVVSEWVLGDEWPTVMGADFARKAYLVSSCLSFFQPGAVKVSNAQLRLRSAHIQDYGHHGEEVLVYDCTAIAQSPSIKSLSLKQTSLAMDGKLTAEASGSTDDGGSIVARLELSSVLETPTIITTKLKLEATDISSTAFSTVLNLPFRTDAGQCSGNLDIDFSDLSNGEIPDIRGDAQLKAVGIRFHPDPNTPEFQDVNGNLRFEGKRMFFDGPTGTLGNIPLSVLGSIHLEDGYELTGYARPIDMNDVIETFKLDNFLPLEGEVVGEMQMTGGLEEPILSGIVKVTGSKIILDRMPVKSGEFTFEWDAAAGILQFPTVSAEAVDGGEIEGNGAIFFDMTTPNEYDLVKEVHHERNPKAIYWNKSVNTAAPPLPAIPVDEFEVDEMAAVRPYDSMVFYFSASGLNGESLLLHFGGDYGERARKAIGTIEGDCVIAGHAKDGNCRVSWRSVSDPPRMSLEDASSRAEVVSKSEENQQNFESSQDLGGGTFKGLAYLKLGDRPEARRVKVRTIVKGLDCRRLAWSIPEFRRHIFAFPLLDTSMDTYFTGILTQQRQLPYQSANRYRSRRMDLLGADGALAVRSLSVNNITFDNVLSGSFSFSKTDMSMSLKQVQSLTDQGRNVERYSERDSDERDVDEIGMTSSVRGNTLLTVKSSGMAVNAVLGPLSDLSQIAKLRLRNVNIQDLTGDDYRFSRNVILGGTIDANVKVDLASNIGDGTIFVRSPRMGSLLLSSIEGNVALRGKEIFLERAVAKYNRASYNVFAKCELGNSEAETSWLMKMDIPKASAQEVSRIVQGAYSTFSFMKTEGLRRENGRSRLFEEFSQLSELPNPRIRHGEDVWEVPSNLPFDEQIQWFLQSREDIESARLDLTTELHSPGFLGIPQGATGLEGDLSGELSVSYEPSPSTRNLRSNGSKDPTPFQLDMLSDLNFSFRFKGENLSMGDVEVKSVDVTGRFDDECMDIGPLTIDGKTGYKAEAQLRITTAGLLDGLLSLDGVPVELLRQTRVLPLDLGGACDGRVSIGGTLGNPKALGRLIWRDAAFNRRNVSGGKFDIACLNGRCIADISGKVSSRGRKRKEFSQTDTDWTENLQEVASQLLRGKRPQSQLDPKTLQRRGELFNVYIDAPVQFYVHRALQGRLPPTVTLGLSPALQLPQVTGSEMLRVDADISKFGLVFLQSAVPDWEWEKGDAEIHLRVSGNVSRPRINGFVQIKDGQVWPKGLSAPVSSVRGNLKFVENGLISITDLSGRCEGKAFGVKGDLFASADYRNETIDRIKNVEEQLKEKVNSKGKRDRDYHSLANELSSLRSYISKGDDGVQVDIGETPIEIEGSLRCRLAGRMRIKGVAQEPLISGYVNIYEGTLRLTSYGPEAGKKYMNGGVKADSKRKETRSNNDEMKRFANSDWKQLKSSSFTKPQNQMQASSEESKEVETGPTSNRNTGFRVRFDNFKVGVGKGMHVVYPYLLNFETTGKMTFNGDGETPDITGKVDLLRGSINVLPSRMTILPYENNYIRFGDKIPGDKTSTGDSLNEPRVKISLENENVIFRVSECELSSWSENLTVTDKAGSGVSDGWWEKIFLPRGNIAQGAPIKTMLSLLFRNVLSFGGKLLGLQWSVFPSPVSADETHFNLQDDAGLGLEVQSKRAKISATRSFGGSTGTKLQLPIFNWLTLTLEREGNVLSFELHHEPK